MFELTIHYEINTLEKITHISNDDLEIKHVIHEVAHGQNHEVIIIPKSPITLSQVILEEPLYLDKKTQVLCNGYQSWTQTKRLNLKDRMRGLDHLPEKLINKFHLRPYGDYGFTTYHRDLWHGFTFAKFLYEKSVRLIGSKNDHQAFLIIYVNQKKNMLCLKADVSGLFIKTPFKAYDFVDYDGNEKTIEALYLNQLPKIKKQETLKGYTSWYRHYQAISSKKLLDDISGMDAKDYDLFQIDDGYQTHIGDWLSIDLEKFPEGFDPILKAVKDKGLMAGLWMAPFVCETDSDIFKHHQDYLARDEHSNLIPAGSNWSGFYALDWQKQDVKAYIKTCLTHYLDMGFSFFKLDFLYAALLSIKKHQTRGQVMHEALVFLRSVLKDATILGCGVPLSSGFGLIDYMRIGPDVSLSFDDQWFMKWIHRERISTKETILNTINRAFLDGHVFYNDPDVYILRYEQNTLTWCQKEALLTINCLFGSLILTSDEISTYDSKQKMAYEKAIKLIKATDLRIKQKGRRISITYELDDATHHMTYDYKKGCFIK